MTIFHYQSLVSSTRPPQNINHGVVFPVIAMHADRCFLLHSRILVHFFIFSKNSTSSHSCSAEAPAAYIHVALYHFC